MDVATQPEIQTTVVQRVARVQHDVLAAYESFPDVFKTAIQIRVFEERLLDLFREGLVRGTVHTCVGQELIGPAVAHWLGPDDVVVSNHRGHGHFIAVTGLIEGLLLEVMGRADGVSGGVGGSQHLVADRFYSNGIQGGMTSIAGGLAMAARLRRSSGVAVAFIGDGTLGEGALYEAVNSAAALGIPLLIVLERNGFAQSTATAETTCGDVLERFRGFGLAAYEADIWNPQQLLTVARMALAGVRQNLAPAMLAVDCYRLNPHSKGDDNRDPQQIAEYRELDPLNLLLDAGFDEVTEHDRACRDALDSMVRQAAQQPILSNVPIQNLRGEDRNYRLQAPFAVGERVNAAINRSLKGLMEADQRIMLLGEDICDRTAGATTDYGGAFKVTRGLSTRFPERVYNFPISESALIGVATGLAMSGLRPVVEIMFGDFLTLCFDQIMQHATKFRRMYRDRVRVPLVIRTPMGGKRGYGPTHSQSIEKFFIGIPGLQVVALNDRIEPDRVYTHLLSDQSQDPVLVIENKVLYTRPLRSPETTPFRAYESDDPLPTLCLTMDDLPPDVTLFCYGEMLETVEQAALAAFRSAEVVCEIICPTAIHPLPANRLVESVKTSRRLVTVEEGPSVAGVGAEVAAIVAESGVAVQRMARLGNNDVLPCSLEAERELIPNVQRVADAILQVCRS